MSTVNQRQQDHDALTELDVVSYLQAHPDFFEAHPKLLETLRLPHRTGGPAVSLVEKQVAVLRQGRLKLERQLRDLVEVARSNDELAARIHGLAVELMRRPDTLSAIECVEEQLRLSFKADRSVLVLFDRQSEFDDTRFLRLLDRNDERMAPFKTFIESGSARCGRVRDAQHSFLFGDDDVEIGSVALLPLGNPDGQGMQGFLAIGSRDADHFHPGKSIDFLEKLGELVTCALNQTASAA